MGWQITAVPATTQVGLEAREPLLFSFGMSKASPGGLEPGLRCALSQLPLSGISRIPTIMFLTVSPQTANVGPLARSLAW